MPLQLLPSAYKRLASTSPKVKRGSTYEYDPFRNIKHVGKKKGEKKIIKDIKIIAWCILGLLRGSHDKTLKKYIGFNFHLLPL